MLTRTSLVLLLIAVSGCAPQDKQLSQSEPAQSAAEELARQAELVRRAAIQSDIHLREQSRDLAFTSLNGHQQRIQSLRGESSDLSNQLEAHNSDVIAYLMNHKIAVACMGTVGMALSDDNAYSDTIKGIVTGVAILCGLGLLSGDFRSEVASVFDRMVQADSRAKNLQSQIRALDEQIAQETYGSTADQTTYDSLTSEIQQLQLRLQDAPSTPLRE
jgi:septal ring factor EnvC (AmiA/AmiB activator)